MSIFSILPHNILKSLLIQLDFFINNIIVISAAYGSHDYAKKCYRKCPNKTHRICADTIALF
jgi:hypothetical protein